ncbi:MAG: hypothetical protein ABEJ42_05700 [Halobacteriaceae archaeon]
MAPPADESGESCAEAGCDRPTAVLLHDPRGADRAVCVGHARALATADGVVAEPLDDAADEWP